MGEHVSPLAVLGCGVSQGLSLSPLIFNIYIQPLIASLPLLDCKVYNYAEDTQLLLQLGNSISSQSNAQAILRFINQWMNANSLK